MNNALLLAVAMLGITVQMRADNVNIPDATFKSLLVAKYDTNKDGNVSAEEAEAVTGTIDVSFKYKIASVKGIEAFRNITGFKCQSNNITGVLDLTNNPKITVLKCSDNKRISKIVLPENSLVTEIECHGIDALTEIDVSRAPKLSTLICYDCIHLTSLDVTKNTQLKHLLCYNCGLDLINLLYNTLNYDSAKPILRVGKQKASDGKTAKVITVLASSHKYNYYNAHLASDTNNVDVDFKTIYWTAIRYKKTGDSDWTYEDVKEKASITDGSYDNYEVLDYKQAFYCDTLDYTRTFKKGIWASWLLPFKVPLNQERMAGLKFAKIVNTTKADGKLKVIVQPLALKDALEANTPYVVLNTTAADIKRTFKVTFQPLVANTGLAPATVGDCTIEYNYGTLTSKDGDDWYALAADESGFTHVTKSGLTLRPFRFLLKVTGGSNQAKIGIAENDATGIQSLRNSCEDDAYYDLTGRRVPHPVRGIYIHQGKKIIIR
jgi:hypothetical protein